MVQQFFGKVAVRVNECNALAVLEMLNEQITKQCCFARSSFADDVHMVAMIARRNAERPGITPALALADDDGWLVIHGSKTSRHSCQTEIPRVV